MRDGGPDEISIRRGFAFSAIGKVTVNTPLSYEATIRSESMSSLMDSCLLYVPVKRSPASHVTPSSEMRAAVRGQGEGRAVYLYVH